eukprot:TRINITY_DN25614_c0_g2_i1.p1 TRINITY_DN25614_c0_g2~~TRINITY_DN25614_c0_g2_i1.p1  ORF type:complete len:178 (+),score=40.75 TRINITY_DN25614_c0_g2_i1:90-623(+)
MDAEASKQLAELGVLPLDENARAQLTAQGLDCAQLERDIADAARQEVEACKVPDHIAEQAVIPADLKDEFDVEVEEQQCSNLSALLQSLGDLDAFSGAHAGARSALEALPALLEVYCSLFPKVRWRAERSERLEAASDALAALLSADNERYLHDELHQGEEIPELSAAVDALRIVLT